MPRPRDPAGYPSQYAQIIHLAATSKNEIHHKCESEKAAQLLRFSFYDYMKACKRSNNPIYQVIVEQSSGLMLCVAGDLLIIKKREDSTVAQELSATIAQYKSGVHPEIEIPDINYPIEAPKKQINILEDLGYLGGKK